MVHKWQKNLNQAIQNLPNIDFEAIFQDIRDRNYLPYDMIKLRGYTHMYRIRIGSYRVVFFDNGIGDTKIISFDKRGQIYGRLKKYTS